MTRGQLSAICRMLELPTVGSKNILAFSIEMRLRNLKADDRVIRREGVEHMTLLEMQQACKERGMRALGLTKEQLEKQIKGWLDLSLNAKVPPSLLLLSRTLYLPQNLDPIAQLAATISALPESAASRVSAEIASKEGKVRNVDKLEVIKEEQKKIEEEAMEEKVRIAAEKAEAERKAAAVAAEAVSQVTGVISEEKGMPKVFKEAAETLHGATVSQAGEVLEKDILIDRAPVMSDKAKILDEVVGVKVPEVKEIQIPKELPEAKKEVSIPLPVKDRELSGEDFADLKTAIEKLGKVKSESDTIVDIKKELEDYKEDVEDLSKVREIVDRSGLKESKGAQRLFSKINKMLHKVDKQVEIRQEKEIAEKADEDLEDRDNLVTINELIKAVQQSGLDSSKVESVVEVCY